MCVFVLNIGRYLFLQLWRFIFTYIDKSLHTYIYISLYICLYVMYVYHILMNRAGDHGATGSSSTVDARVSPPSILLRHQRLEIARERGESRRLVERMMGDAPRPRGKKSKRK